MSATSDCCDAPIWSGGMCSFCKEHCEPVPDQSDLAEINEAIETLSPVKSMKTENTSEEVWAKLYEAGYAPPSGSAVEGIGLLVAKIDTLEAEKLSLIKEMKDVLYFVQMRRQVPTDALIAITAAIARATPPSAAGA